MRQQPAKPARRRAKQDRARTTVAAVIEAAAQVLQREGYSRATTNRIAEAAGVSIGTIYQYFGDKEQIFDALIRREVDSLQRVLQSFPPNPRQPIGTALRDLLHALVRARPQAPLLYRSLEHVPNALFRRRLAAARGGVVEWVRGFLAAHRRELRVRDLDTSAFLLVSAAEGVAMNASPEFFRERVADEVATLFERHLTRRSA